MAFCWAAVLETLCHERDWVVLKQDFVSHGKHKIVASTLEAMQETLAWQDVCMRLREGESEEGPAGTSKIRLCQLSRLKREIARAVPKAPQLLVEAPGAHCKGSRFVFGCRKLHVQIK